MTVTMGTVEPIHFSTAREVWTLSVVNWSQIRVLGDEFQALQQAITGFLFEGLFIAMLAQRVFGR